MSVSKATSSAKKPLTLSKTAAKPPAKKIAASASASKVPAKSTTKAAPAKPAVKTTTAKKAAAAKPAPAKEKAAKDNGATPITPEQRYRMICDAAYYRAERRGFIGGNPAEDWTAAEAEIDGLLLSMRH